MTKSAQILMDEALALPPIDRASIIEGLISSFDPQSRSEIDRAWAREAEARIDAYDKGTSKARTLKSFVDRVNRA